MADMYLRSTTNSPVRVADGNTLLARGTRDGSLFTAAWLEALAQEGRIFHANGGSAATALTFLIFGANRPDFWIRIPSGTTVLPIKVNVSLTAMVGAVTLIEVRTASNDIGNGTSSAATVAQQAARSDAPISSGCTARQLATGDTTAETTPLSLYRRTYIRADDAGSDWKGIEITRELMGYPLLVGPATLQVFISATTTQATGFVAVTWAEVPSSSIV